MGKGGKLIDARGVRKSYSRTGEAFAKGGSEFTAVDDVSFSVEAGETLRWLARVVAGRLRWRDCCRG